MRQVTRSVNQLAGTKPNVWRANYCTVRVRLKDCTVLPELAATIFTVEVPAGVTGALGVLGVLGVLGAVDWAEEPPPPHPFSSQVPASKLNKMSKWQARAESLRFLPASAIVSKPGAQNAAAGSSGLFSDGKGFVKCSFAVFPAVCMVTTVVCGPLVPLTVTVAG
jgi:hypothetical protein